jgi:hypothetical protein
MGDGGNRNACSGVHGRYSLVTWASRSNQPSLSIHAAGDAASCLGSSRGAAALPSNETRHDGARPDTLPEGQFSTGS